MRVSDSVRWVRLDKRPADRFPGRRRRRGVGVYSTALEVVIDGGRRRISRDLRLHVIDGGGGGDLFTILMLISLPTDRPCYSKALATVISSISLPVVEIFQVLYNPNPIDDGGLRWRRRRLDSYRIRRF